MSCARYTLTTLAVKTKYYLQASYTNLDDPGGGVLVVHGLV